MSRRWTAITLVSLTLLAAALRLFRLDSVPPGLFLDEAGNGLDALEVLDGRLQIFFERSLGKEPLLNYLITPFVAWLGRAPLAVRLPAALAGVLAVPATFLLVRELLWEEGEEKATWAGLFAAGLLAASYWAVTLNRISFRANTLPVVAALAFAIAWRTLRVGGKGQAAVSGLLLGLCFYTYLAGRFVYPLALVGLGLVMLTPAGRLQARRRRSELLLVAAICLVVMLPLLLHFALHPEDFMRRAGMVLFTASSASESTALQQLQQSLLGNVGMFGGAGDLEPRHNLPGRSLLTPWLAVLFWSGVGLALVGPVAARRPNGDAQNRFAQQVGPGGEGHGESCAAVGANGARSVVRPASPGLQVSMLRAKRRFAVAWFAVFLLPAILAATPPRHALRVIGAQPIVYFLCALTIVEVAGWLASHDVAKDRSFAPAPIMGFLLATLVTIEATLTAYTYFNRWAGDPLIYSAYLGQDRAIAEEINQAPPDVRYVVPLNDRWRELGGKYTLDFLAGRPEHALYFFAQAPDATTRLADFVNSPGLREVRLVRTIDGDDVSADPQEVAALLLGQSGQSVEIRDGRGYYVELFRPTLRDPGALALPQPEQPARARFTNSAGQGLTLTGWGAATSAAAPGANITAGGLGTLALRWQTDQPPMEQLRVSVRLVNALNQSVGQADSMLVDTWPRYNPDWQAGDNPVTYHRMAVAPGTPPGDYAVLISVYDAASQQRLAAVGEDVLPRDWVELGPVQVTQPLPGAPVYTPDHVLPHPTILAPGLTVLGHDALPAVALPGLPINLALGWEVTTPTVDQTLAVLLDERVVSRVALASLPPGRWRTAHQVLLPTDLAPGDYQLALRAEAPAAQTPAVDLGIITVEELPQPEYTLEADFVNGALLAGWRVDPHPDGLLVTLFWQTARPLDQDLSVFLHVVDSAGQLVAQHDAAPDNGRLPTTAWRPEALITDRHVVPLPGLDNALRLRAGLYLPGSGVRIPRADGSDFVEWSASGVSP